MTRRPARAVAALAFALLLAGCPSDTPNRPYAFPPGASVELYVEVTERLDHGGERSWRRLDLTLLGRMGESGACRLDVHSTAYEYEGRDGERRRLSADVVATDPLLHSSEDLGHIAVLDALGGAAVSLRFDPEEGVDQFSGLDARLAEVGSAADPIAAAARDGLLELASDDAVLRGLRAAGLQAVPADVHDDLLDVRRTATVVVPGRGRAVLRLAGLQGEGSEGSTVVRFSGSFPAGQEFAGESEPPPEWVGAVDLTRVEASGTTQYRNSAPIPLQGKFVLSLPFEQGAVLTRQLEFTLLVRP